MIFTIKHNNSTFKCIYRDDTVLFIDNITTETISITNCAETVAALAAKKLMRNPQSLRFFEYYEGQEGIDEIKLEWVIIDDEYISQKVNWVNSDINIKFWR